MSEEHPVGEPERVDRHDVDRHDVDRHDVDRHDDEPVNDGLVNDGSTLTEDELAEDDLGAPSLTSAIEALLLLADEPMKILSLAQATKRPVDEVQEAVLRLSAEYTEQQRGFDLREVAGGWRYYTRMECSALVERWVLDGQQARLTQASLETLAVIAYRQPISRGRISAVRGVNVDGVIRTLVARGLIEEAGHEDESHSILYRTTAHFLERIGAASLNDLPLLADHLPNLAELDDVLDSVAIGD